jgi:hypothetical protein
MGPIWACRLGGDKRDSRLGGVILESSGGLIRDSKGGLIRELEGRVLGLTTVRFSRYMSLEMLPVMIVLLTDKEMVLLPRVEMTSALSNWMPLMRFERAVGM